MIIKREETDEVIKALYESSNIVASKYYKKTNDLAITFKTGQEYVYESVNIQDYHAFELADSQGKIFNKYIKQYSFKKGDVVDVVQLKEELEKVRQEELNQMAEVISETACDIYFDFQKTGQLTITTLEGLVQKINHYTEKVKENVK